MYDYISGKITEASPSHSVIETNGIGWFIDISLHTYTEIQEKKEAKLYIHFAVREDAHKFYGFATKSEREIFRLLISVSGIGANTARVMLSTLSPGEIKNAINTDNVNVIKSVKGIGLKTAQKVIIELRDKINKTAAQEIQAGTAKLNPVKEEALAALTMLGFVKKASEKALDKIVATNPNITVEQAVKEALKKM